MTLSLFVSGGLDYNTATSLLSHINLKIACVSISEGPPDAGPRVILSVDLWHPNVAAAERQALDFMFSPDL